VNWRVVCVGEGHCFLVHVSGRSEAEAHRAAREKVARDFRVQLPRVRSAERIEA